MCVCVNTAKLGKMDNDLKEYMVEKGHEAGEIVKALGFNEGHSAYFELMKVYIPLLARHSYYLRDMLAMRKKDVDFEEAK